MVLVYCVKLAFHPDVLSSLLSFISGDCSIAKVNTELYFDLDNLVRKDSRSTGGGNSTVLHRFASGRARKVKNFSRDDALMLRAIGAYRIILACYIPKRTRIYRKHSDR